jgi:SAM-dependent methyltransferase
MHPLELMWARATSWIYKGDKYFCNLCGFGARRLRRRGHNHPVIVSKQISGAGRRRVDCPKCLSSDRDRQIWDFLNQHFPILSEPNPKNNLKNQSSSDFKSSPNPSTKFSILHVAPEIPLSNKLRAIEDQKKIEYHCIDLKTPGYHYPNWVQHADLTSLPFKSNQFDIVIASHVLEHIPNLQKALQEIHRTLKTEGQAILLFPVSLSQPTDDYYHPSDFEEHKSPKIAPTKREKIERFGQHDHIRLFGTDAAQILSQNNWFDVNVMNAQGCKDFPGQHEGPTSKNSNFFFILKKR